MALTKISGGVIQQPIDVGIITATSGDFSGIVTASSVVASSVNVSSASTIGNTVVGGATTELVVSGSVHITNRLDVGGLISAEESAIIMNPNSISRSYSRYFCPSTPSPSFTITSACWCSL